MDVNAERLSYLIQFLEDRVSDPRIVDAALGQCGLSRQASAPFSKMISYEKEVLFVRAACDATGDRTFGAAAGLGLGHHSFNSLTGYIGKHSRDLRAAIENTSRFHDIIDPALAFALRVSGNSASVEFNWKDARFAKYHRHTEFLIFGALSRFRAFTQVDFFPVEVRLDHDVGALVSAYRDLAGFPVVFGAERIEIILSLPSLDLPIPTYDLGLREHLMNYGDRLLMELPAKKLELRSRIEGLITAALPTRMPSVNDIAASLGMSPRTFARRLNEDGTSYREIVDDLRCDLARTFLKNGMSLSEIAFSLGYKDQSAFSVAYKRWTGTAPSNSFQVKNQ
jgi:AraC-like DNA-binding protein